MNGWKNYETWNVSLWIQNDETLYNLALASAGFQDFMNDMIGCGCPVTGDGVKWGDADYSEVQSMFNEMKATTDFQYWKSALVHFQKCPIIPLQGGFLVYNRIMKHIKTFTDSQLEMLVELVGFAYEMDVPDAKGWDSQEFDDLYEEIISP